MNALKIGPMTIVGHEFEVEGETPLTPVMAVQLREHASGEPVSQMGVHFEPDQTGWPIISTPEGRVPIPGPDSELDKLSDAVLSRVQALAMFN